MHYPDDRKYAESHEWARSDGDTSVRVGISDYAQDALGDIVFVDLPPLGATTTAGEPLAEVESTKSVSEIYAPVTGTVIAVNEALDASPELVNSDPFGEGWFVVIEVADLSGLESLLSAADYESSVT